MFQLHPQLAKDCHQLGRLTACHVLLHKNSSVPWFILVPETEVIDLLDLPKEQRQHVMDEAAAIAAFVKDFFQSPRMNFAAIGNLVPQMHLHIVGRSPDDPCWPQPVWGNLQWAKDYSPQTIGTIIHQLESSLQLKTRGN